MNTSIYRDISDDAVKILARNYNILDYTNKLVELLSDVYPYIDFKEYSKYDLHYLLNETLLEKYNGEQIHKYNLFQKQVNKKDTIAAFEVRIDSSRLDFLTINGNTTSFEIKSALDNFSKFRKQAANYALAFEYNYLVVDICHIEKAKELLPDSFGLIAYKLGKYRKEVKASINTKIDAEFQLKLLTKKEIFKSFPEANGDIEEILNNCDNNEINNRFKLALKSRYRDRWEFLRLHQNNILPFDIQFFFNANIQPNYIYHC